MKRIELVGLVDPRGWVLLQERDEHAPVEPDRWWLVGGGVEDGETPEDAAYRELREETGIVCDDLVSSGRHALPCRFHGRDQIHLFTARTSVRQEAVVCGEGRQIVFVDPRAIPTLDLTASSRALLPLVLDSAGVQAHIAAVAPTFFTYS
jgi:8-oxo-dGTP pyrophosphatase MutT (NUDIX family)